MMQGGVWLLVLLGYQSSAAEMFVTVGSTATISLAGDTSEGCKMLQELPSSRVISCCFSAASREDRLCDPDMFSDDCRGHGGEGGFTLEEREGRCVLTLNNFTRKDEGTYDASFNANPEDNKYIKVIVKSGRQSWELQMTLALVGIVVLLFVAVILYCCLRRRRGEAQRGYVLRNYPTRIDYNSDSDSDM